ncbi:NAD(+) kinase [Thiohalocapsa marina]|uniref:NAD kinase n=1 Tax=Thiohalocapsa marina TaxID=424902 RepID=A0A5M8FSJ0_9GAMM|nr:NAD(+) kinase [Thiohalocapsa marina]KAA6185152.1 NAD(+) kinase [Thiohalocapsa marina]
MATFQTLGIVGKQHDDPPTRATIQRLVGHLHRRAIAVRLEQQLAAALNAAPGVPLSQLGHHCDLVVVVGGDGTLLHAAREISAQQIPLVGINLGRLGFLVDVSPSDLEHGLDRILDGEFEVDDRSVLDARIEGARGRAVNDVVIHKWNTVRMIEFETYIDGRFVNAQRSDGLIISTPTGSTAYALSGGGPLIHPRIDALVLVPICPHTLSNRPLVVAGDSHIEIRICGDDLEQVRVTCDGQLDLPLIPGAPVRIERSAHRLRLLHPRGHDHYAILRAKLGWGGHIRAGVPC